MCLFGSGPPHIRLTCVATDINKFLWMVRIGGSTDTGRHIKEHDYYTPTGEFRVDREGSPVLLNCLMYKMCYYRFGQVYTEASKYSRPLAVEARCVSVWGLGRILDSYLLTILHVSANVFHHSVEFEMRRVRPAAVCRLGLCI